MNYLKDGNLKCFLRSIINFYRLKKELIYTAIKDIKNSKKTKTIKCRILRDVKNLLELEEEEENCHKTVRVNNVWNNNYI